MERELKRILAGALALSLLLLAGCGTVVPRPRAGTAPQTETVVTPAAEPEESAPPEPEAEREEIAPEPETPAAEAGEELPVSEEEAQPELPPASEAAPQVEPEAEPTEEAETETEEAPMEEAPAEEEAPEEPSTEETEEAPAPSEELPPEDESAPRAVVTFRSETTEYPSADGKAILLRDTAELPQLRLLGVPLAVEARINRTLEEDLQVLRDSLLQPDGRTYFYALAEDEYYPSFVDAGQEEDFPTFIQKRRISVARCDSRVLSFEYSDEMYAGGAHGSVMLHGISYLLSTGELLRFETLSDRPAELRQRCVDCIVRRIWTDYEAGTFIEGYAAQLPALVADPNWYLGEEGLVVVIQQYALSYGAMGTPHFTVPYEEIEDLLRPELLPARRPEAAGRLPGTDETETADFTVLCGDGEGQLAFAAEGTVYDLELETLRYTYEEDGSFLPLAQQTLWCCSRLEDGETLLLEGLEVQPVPALRLRWRTSDGEEQLYLLNCTEEGYTYFNRQ